MLPTIFSSRKLRNFEHFLISSFIFSYSSSWRGSCNKKGKDERFQSPTNLKQGNVDYLVSSQNVVRASASQPETMFFKKINLRNRNSVILNYQTSFRTARLRNSALRGTASRPPRSAGRRWGPKRRRKTKMGDGPGFKKLGIWNDRFDLFFSWQFLLPS